MLKGKFPIDKFKALTTPFYYYNIELLKETLDMVKTEAGKYGYHAHYAVKANANPRILSVIAEYGLGADCVSGGEIQAALDAGFPAGKIVFAGVGKADWEINLGLDNDIFCFNVESAAELEILDELAAAKNKVASIALRINPEVDAHTHAKITTGMKENKFGINLSQLGQVLDLVSRLEQVGGQAVLGRQLELPTPWLTERHGYDPTSVIFSIAVIGIPAATLPTTGTVIPFSLPLSFIALLWLSNFSI